MKLPNFKVTQRANKSRTARMNLPRGRKDVKYAKARDGEDQGESASCAELALSRAPLLPELCSIDEEPIRSLHAIKQAANTEAWKAIRTDLL